MFVGRFMNKVNKQYIFNKKNKSLSEKSRHFASSATRTMKIGTHSGTFHCDEALACYMLKSLPEYRDAEIVRTRNLDILNECDIVVDVGAVFNHETKRYDHHQIHFNETLSTLRPELGDKYKIRLSSAGLVYTFYGEKVIQTLAAKDVPLESNDLRNIYLKVYENLIQEIDAIDNGVPIAPEEPKYKIHTHLSARVGRLNSVWNSSKTFDEDKEFQKAMALVKEEFEHCVNYYISTWLPARDHVKSALEERMQVNSTGEIMLLTEFVPWKEHLFDLEKELKLEEQLKFVLFKDTTNTWRVQAVPIQPSSFVLRKPLNQKWWGIRDEMLSKESGVEGCMFCHSTGFIGGNKTKEGALKMAIASL